MCRPLCQDKQEVNPGARHSDRKEEADGEAGDQVWVLLGASYRTKAAETLLLPREGHQALDTHSKGCAL